MKKYVDVQLVVGNGGHTNLQICNEKGHGQRVAGPKAWGGGVVKHSFTVEVEEFIKAIEQYSYKEEAE